MCTLAATAPFFCLSHKRITFVWSVCSRTRTHFSLLLLCSYQLGQVIVFFVPKKAYAYFFYKKVLRVSGDCECCCQYWAYNNKVTDCQQYEVNYDACIAFCEENGWSHYDDTSGDMCKPSSSLSGGAIAGIVIGVLVFVAAGVAGVVVVLLYLRRKKTAEYQPVIAVPAENNA